MKIGADGKFIPSTKSIAGETFVETGTGGIKPVVDIASGNQLPGTMSFQINLQNTALAAQVALLFDGWGGVAFQNAAFFDAANLTVVNNWVVTGTYGANTALFLQRMTTSNPIYITGLQFNTTNAATSLNTPPIAWGLNARGGIDQLPFNTAEALSQQALNNNILPFPNFVGVFDGSKALSLSVAPAETLRLTMMISLQANTRGFNRVS